VVLFGARAKGATKTTRNGSLLSWGAALPGGCPVFTWVAPHGGTKASSEVARSPRGAGIAARCQGERDPAGRGEQG
jgi:hypothetical protein